MSGPVALSGIPAIVVQCYAAAGILLFITSSTNLIQEYMRAFLAHGPITTPQYGVAGYSWSRQIRPINQACNPLTHSGILTSFVHQTEEKDKTGSMKLYLPETCMSRRPYSRRYPKFPPPSHLAIHAIPLTLDSFPHLSEHLTTASSLARFVFVKLPCSPR